MVNRPKPWFFITTILLIVVIWLLGAWVKFLYTPLVTDEQGYRYTVRSGTSLHAVIDDLYIRNIIKNRLFFKILARLKKNAAHELKFGEYLFPKGSTPTSVLEQITHGTGMIYHTFTIVPGWNFRELRQAILQNENFRHNIQDLTDDQIMRILGHPELKPEGEFYPDTYYFVEGSDDVIILKRSFKAMQGKLKTAWEHRASDLPFKTSYEALIAASIIEKEAYLETELPKMAGVMVNRLKKDMPLQFDPTVIYGMGIHYNGTLHKSDLQKNTPYNTYINKGLTPTPISMPSLKAIEAVMHPEHNSYYYFVARGGGAHQFSADLAEHNQAVALARQTKEWFFNFDLTRRYLLKQIFQKFNLISVVDARD